MIFWTFGGPPWFLSFMLYGPNPVSFLFLHAVPFLVLAFDVTPPDYGVLSFLRRIGAGHTAWRFP